MTEGVITVERLLDRRVRWPIEEQAGEYYVKTDPMSGEKITYAANEVVKSDVDVMILRNISSRKKNILPREGD